MAELNFRAGKIQDRKELTRMLVEGFHSKALAIFSMFGENRVKIWALIPTAGGRITKEDRTFAKMVAQSINNVEVFANILTEVCKCQTITHEGVECYVVPKSLMETPTIALEKSIYELTPASKVKKPARPHQQEKKG